MKIILLSVILFFLQLPSIAQVSLEIECHQNIQMNLSNRISMDGNLLEYGICGIVPSFYVSVIDTNCIAWCAGAAGSVSDFGNINNFGVCKPRCENYFVYRQKDSLQLVYLDSLLNYWIPDDHVIAIWTPFFYNFDSVNTVCPQLANTLVNKWGNNVQSDSIIVLFGVQGVPQSFSVDTLSNGISINVSKTICPYPNPNPYPSLGIEENSNTQNKYLVRIVDLMGRETEKKSNTWLIYIYSDGTIEKVFRIE